VNAEATLAALGAVAATAIAAAGIAIGWGRAARAARRADKAQSDQRIDALEAGSRLAADLAHDLDNLLTAVVGQAELLMAGMDPSAAQSQGAREIRDAALKAARLTRPLRSVGGTRPSSTDVIDVNDVITTAAGFLRRKLGPGIEVKLMLDPAVKPIRIGAGRLDALVLTLGIRAGETMPDGGRLTIATAVDARGGRHQAEGGAVPEYTRLIMTNNGVGRVASPASVVEIVNEAGGRLLAESADGAGTTFTIDLPATSEPVAPIRAAAADLRSRPPVLVVEDEPGVRELITVVLARAGHEVVAVDGPHAALAALHRHPVISLMLVDVIMPEMDGYDFVAEARKSAPAVQVIFMSSFAPDASRQAARDRFLAKPFNVEQLTALVSETLAEAPRV
jgi:two-component system cell cycle sensor histidine kinase/response regulator CckA